VSLGAVRMAAISASGVEVALSLAVANPNARSIEIASLDFTVEINGIPAVDARTREPVAIAAGAAGEVTVMAKSNFANWTTIARRLSGKSSLDYVITGTARIEGVTLPFSRRGEIGAAALLGRPS